MEHLFFFSVDWLSLHVPDLLLRPTGGKTLRSFWPQSCYNHWCLGVCDRTCCDFSGSEYIRDILDIQHHICFWRLLYLHQRICHCAQVFFEIPFISNWNDCGGAWSRHIRNEPYFSTLYRGAWMAWGIFRNGWYHRICLSPWLCI